MKPALPEHNAPSKKAEAVCQPKEKYRAIMQTKQKIDIAERVFIEIFLNNYNFNSTKISKVHYLFNLLKELIRK